MDSSKQVARGALYCGISGRKRSSDCLDHQLATACHRPIFSECLKPYRYEVRASPAQHQSMAKPVTALYLTPPVGSQRLVNKVLER